MGRGVCCLCFQVMGSRREGNVTLWWFCGRWCFLVVVRVQAALDAGAAALIEPDNFKAWLRKATAHKELGQWYECNQAAKNAMKVDAKNEDILAMMEESTFKMGAGIPMAAQVAPEAQRRRFGVF